LRSYGLITFLAATRGENKVRAEPEPETIL